MNKKSIVVFVFVVAFALCMLCACNAHTHTFEQGFGGKDETHHWHKATCEHADEISGKAAHTFENGTCTACGYKKVVPEITYAELLQNHKDKVVDFFETFVKPQAVGEVQLVAGGESWRIADTNGDDKIDFAQMTFVGKTGDDTRAVQVADVTFNTPVTAQDVVDEAVSSVDVTVLRKDAFTFNARENFEHSKVGSALSQIAKADDSDTIVVFQETVGEYSDERAFNVFVNDGNGYKTVTVYVSKGDGSEEALLKNLSDPTEYTTGLDKHETSYTGDTIYVGAAYQLENLGTVTPDPDPDVPPDPIVDEVKNSELIASLTTNCQQSLVEKCLIGITIDANNITDSQWYVNKDSEGNITSAQYTGVYNQTATSTWYVSGTATFSSPISAKDLKDGNLGNVTYSRNYRFNYNASIQAEHQELTDAICDKLLGEIEGAIRYIKLGGKGTDSTLGYITSQFTVIQIVNGQIQETSVSIKDSKNDAEFIQNLNASNYNELGKESYQINGDILVAETETANYSYEK